MTMPIKKTNINSPNDVFPHVVYWSDSEPTGAIGWLVIDSLASGVATGGTFMHPYASQHEVAALAAAMTRKNFLQIPPVGGAKAGIKFDPDLPDADRVLQRFLLFNQQYLETIWSTGADLNTNNHTINRIICDEMDLLSGQHSLGKILGEIYGIPNEAVCFLLCIEIGINRFCVDLFATVYSIITCFKELSLAHLDTIIQGWGVVGRNIGYLLHKEKLARVKGIIEKDYFLYEESGLNTPDLLDLSTSCMNDGKLNLNSYLSKVREKGYSVKERSTHQSSEDFLIECLEMQADLFCPCANRYAITKKLASCLLNKTFKGKDNRWIISGANNIFHNEAVVQVLEKSGINLLPEWISSSGNTLLYNEILKRQHPERGTPEHLLSIVKHRIKDFLNEALQKKSRSAVSLYRACYTLIDERIEEKSSQTVT